MTIFRKTAGGLFAPITALSINDEGAFKSVVAAWVNDGGIFKKVFPDIVEDPAADYNMAGASSPSLTRTQTSESAIQNAFVINGQIIPLKSNLTANNIDVDWSALDIIAIDTQEALPFGVWSTSNADEMWISVELKDGVLTNTRMNGVTAAVNLSNYCPPPRDWKVRLSSGTNGTDMLIKYGWYDYSAFYGRQIGIRWRWHSLLNRKYYEHIFTKGNMVLNALS
ncbi:hypothetical protein ACN0IV_14645 [Trabulsiella odontotermitis]|uniref:hypothetical protein n=1 Tax=Trabulsiella odontotermitis TaxID=379893 RepID=UPI003AD797E4